MKTTINSLEGLPTLVAIVDAGSVTKAAQELDLPKSSVSRKLRALEERLGLQLLQRTTRRLGLTAAGEHYYRQAKRLLLEVSDLERSVSGYSSQAQGPLRVTCPAGLCLANFAVFQEFCLQYPLIQLQLDETDRFVDLEGEGFDLALRGQNHLTRRPMPNLESHRLLRTELIFVAHPDLLQFENGVGVGVPGEFLDSQKLICLGNHVAVEWPLENTSSGRKVRYCPQPSLIFNNLGSLVKAVRCGLGIAPVPLCGVQQMLERGELVRLLPDWRAGEASLWMLHSKNRPLSLPARRFSEHLLEQRERLQLHL